MKALTLFLAAAAALYTSSAWSAPVSPKDVVNENRKSVFYCKTLGDALSIAVQEEESLALGETDREFINRIKHLVIENRCAVDSFLKYMESETLCQWYGVVVEKDHILGRKYVVKVKERNHVHPLYVIVTERDPLFSQLPPTASQCSSIKNSK